MPLSFFFFAALILGLTAAWDLASTGSTVILNGVPYYIPGTPYASRPSFKASNSTTILGRLVPLTVVATSSVTFNLADLEKTVKGFQETDDVWQAAFLSGMLREPNKLEIRDDQIDFYLHTHTSTSVVKFFTF